MAKPELLVKYLLFKNFKLKLKGIFGCVFFFFLFVCGCGLGGLA